MITPSIACCRRHTNYQCELHTNPFCCEHHTQCTGRVIFTSFSQSNNINFALCKWAHIHSHIHTHNTEQSALDCRYCPYYHAQPDSVCGQDHMAPLVSTTLLTELGKNGTILIQYIDCTAHNTYAHTHTHTHTHTNSIRTWLHGGYECWIVAIIIKTTCWNQVDTVNSIIASQSAT